MYKIEVNSIINQVIGAFYRFSLWVKVDDESTARKVKIKFFHLINFSIFLLSLAAGTATSDDQDEVVFLSAVTIINVVLSGKLIYIVWKQLEILAFFNEICVHSIEDQEEFIRVNNKLKNFVKFGYFFMLMIFCGAVFLIGLPAFSGGKNLPFNIWFPLDYKCNEIVYWIAFVYVAFFTIFAVLCSALSIIVWYIMANCAIKFKLLGSQLRNLGEMKVEKTAIKKRKISETEKQNLYHRDLIAVIKSHLKLKNITDTFQTFFSNLFFLQIATSGFGICCSIYTLAFTSSDRVIRYVIYFILLAYYIFDVVVITYLGNEIERNSDQLSYCLFESNWIDQSMSTKKCIIVLMEVLKQRQQIVVWKLYPLNLELFTRIINLAYSMFNILQNLT